MADVRRDKNKGFENFAYLCKQSEQVQEENEI